MSCPQLLISVRDPEEAAAALLGGADLIDAKEPTRGALAAVRLDVFRAIVARVDGRAPVTAALDDADDARSVRARTRAFATAGARFVKLGFAGHHDRVRIESLLRAAVEAGEGESDVVAVGYADFAQAAGPDPFALIDLAAGTGARGVLLDTASKSGAGLCELMEVSAVTTWIRRAQAAGLFSAVAGKLASDDVARLRQTGADIIGVRGAACENGREGTVNSDRVLTLRQRLIDGTPATALGQAASRLSQSSGNVGEDIVGASELRRRQANIRHV